MELNTTAEHELDLNEPHFDEEATVLSAKPVVPLEEIKTRETSKKRLVLGAAMLFAVLVGAVGGVFVYKQRSENETNASALTANPEVEGSAGALAEPATAEHSVAEAGSGAVPEAQPREVKKSQPQTTVPKSVTVVSAPEKTNKRVKHGESDDMIIADRDDDERELRRQQRMEARQMRRRGEWVDMREGRRRRNNSDDLLRIRDIFEGPRRPY